MSKSFATRLEPELEKRFAHAVKVTGIRPADLIRYGIRKAVAQIEKDGGLLLKIAPHAPRRQSPTRKGGK